MWKISVISVRGLWCGVFFCFDFFLDDGPSLPTRQNEEFRPFIRRLPEFKFWWVDPSAHAPFLKNVTICIKLVVAGIEGLTVNIIFKALCH